MPPTSKARAALSPAIPARARLHVVTGKGGTGKTTAAVSLALALVAGGRKVLVVEVEGRQALAQLFDVAALPYEERRLVSGPGNASLWGLAIDAEQAMIEYLDMFYGLKRSARGLKKMGAVDFVTTLAPGLRDVLLTGKVKEAVTRTDADGHPAYDAVVLDAPPTGRITKFLSATTEVANLTKFGPINRQSEGVIQLLHGRQTAVHLVTLLEEMPVQETIDAAADLRAAGFPLGAVIVNRARPALIEDGAVDTKLLTAGLRKVNLPAALVKGLVREVGDYADRLAIQVENADRLDELGLPRIELPDLNPPVERGELNELAERFLA
ncbi:MAG: ArsA-related P-loop ATPase [Jatrophihabitantaceae bacterium]